MPVLVYINGGGWSSDNKDMGIARLILAAQQGYFCVTIEHRLCAEKKGNPPAAFPAQIEDCKCAVRYLRAKAKEYHLDTNRIGAWGGSSGGHLAALLGTSANAKDLEGTGGWPGLSSQVHAVCAYCPPTDFLAAEWPEGMRNGLFTRLLGGHPKDKADLAKKASPMTYIARECPPFLIMHGSADNLVPFKQGERLFEALKKAGVEASFETVKGKGHEELDPGNVYAMKFFNKQFKSSDK
jgi:acetyl esterase/lipase